MQKSGTEKHRAGSSPWAYQGWGRGGQAGDSGGPRALSGPGLGPSRPASGAVERPQSRGGLCAEIGPTCARFSHLPGRSQVGTKTSAFAGAAVSRPGLDAPEGQRETCWVALKRERGKEEKEKEKRKRKSVPCARTRAPTRPARSPALRHRIPIQQQRSAQRSCAVAGLELGAIGLSSSPAAP
ncbi:unnamed protein product [Nyctereutes procyonoides]|uniref:(raccoon dog) hypothetical protein n=1 Tax=Nyctereutes procyonoides TaxID=34880 RepID=A0A811XW54_NYCPR|nr:unnamed protein product [Nyctereutes procyonoides]